MTADDRPIPARSPWRTIRDDPDFAGSMQRRPISFRPAARHVAAVVLTALFTALPAAAAYAMIRLAVKSFRMPDEPSEWLWVLLVPVWLAAGIVMVVRSVGQLREFLRSETRAFPARIASKEAIPYRSRYTSQTFHCVTLECEDRPDLRCDSTGALFESVSEGDLGVAFVRGGHLLEFRPVQR